VRFSSPTFAPSTRSVQSASETRFYPHGIIQTLLAE
jgi:hypothetical protein